MSKKEDIKKELDDLVEEGDEIFKSFNQEKKLDSLRYQTWYTKSRALVEKCIPERLEEFDGLYKSEHQKELPSNMTYSVYDFVLGRSYGYGFDADSCHSLAGRKFKPQIDILGSARASIDSLLFNLTGVLQADLFDNELGAAGHLLENGHVRAAGAVAGVILEGHLKQLCKNHSIVINKKTPTLNDFNQALFDNKVYDQVRWRGIQKLGDIRNSCDHAGDEPSTDNVKLLLTETDTIIKLVF